MSSASVDFAAVRENVSKIRQRILAAGGIATQLIAVTKGFGIDAIEAATSANCDGIGENYAQELLKKYSKDGSLLGENAKQLPVHFIGQLQSNKILGLLGVVNYWQTVDRVSVITQLAKSRQVPAPEIFVQVNSTGEQSKGGCAPGEVEELCLAATQAGLLVVGLMTIGPTNGSIQECEKAFRGVRKMADNLGLAQCSMGMSDDFECAVGCGSTIVRVGSGIFGARPTSARASEIT